MEILKRGIPPSERTYIGTCNICSTSVKFTQGEASCSSDQRDPGYYVRCPVCKTGTIWGLAGR